jgi:hypothetical protein
MCGFLEERFYEPIEPTAHADVSQERIHALAFAKLREQNGIMPKHKEKHMKTSVKILLAAALVCVMSVTAFAAMGGMDFFRSIFGDSAEVAAENIQFPDISYETGNYILTAESLLSDGFNTDLIVSLTAKDGWVFPDDPYEHLAARLTRYIGGRILTDVASCEEMPDFAREDTKYYHISLTTMDDHSSAYVSVSFSGNNAHGGLRVPIGDAITARKEIHVNAADYADQNYYPETVQLSPMGWLVIGREKEASGGLPTVQVFIQMKDGTREELLSVMSFDDGDGKTVAGGGSAVLPGPFDTPPLVTETMGKRNPNDKVNITGSFSRILNLDDVQAIIVDDVEYPLS